MTEPTPDIDGMPAFRPAPWRAELDAVIAEAKARAADGVAALALLTRLARLGNNGELIDWRIETTPRGDHYLHVEAIWLHLSDAEASLLRRLSDLPATQEETE